jgi:anti-sigma B factor antagonist
VPLTLEHRRVGDITIVTCAGRIVEGTESIALQQMLDDLFIYGPYLVLHLGAVDFVDSSGLGLLIRNITRAKRAHGNVRLCGLSARLIEALEVTHLRPICDAHETEDEAIAAFYERTASGGGVTPLHADILCVTASSDVQAYVRGLLTQAGYGVQTAGNLPDGLILLQVSHPKLVIVDAALRQTRETRTAEKFNGLADKLRVLELPADFSRSDAGQAGQQLLDQVRAATAGA